jgi:hypothetical protein
MIRLCDCGKRLLCNCVKELIMDFSAVQEENDEMKDKVLRSQTIVPLNSALPDHVGTVYYVIVTILLVGTKVLTEQKR